MQEAQAKQITAQASVMSAQSAQAAGTAVGYRRSGQKNDLKTARPDK
jgi:hypothetical protein